MYREPSRCPRNRDHDAGGEGGVVEAVVGVQDHKMSSAGHGGRGLLAVEHRKFSANVSRRVQARRSRERRSEEAKAGVQACVEGLLALTSHVARSGRACGKGLLVFQGGASAGDLGDVRDPLKHPSVAAGIGPG